MDTEPSSNAKIDRLSALPPELLWTIFDLAYDPVSLYLGPISRRLLPCFIRNLYRQIRLSSVDSWSKLLQRIEATPVLGGYVRVLDISSVCARGLRGNLIKIIASFPRLASIKTGLVDSLEALSLSALPPLQLISYQSLHLGASDFDVLSHFSHLTTLAIKFPMIDFEPQHSPSITLPSVKNLKLWHESVNEAHSQLSARRLPPFLEQFPNLIELNLLNDGYSYFGNALPHLDFLFARLTTLSLGSYQKNHRQELVCDHYLPLFPNLEHLYLTQFAVSHTLVDHLRKLPLLATLHLDRDTHLHGPTSIELLFLIHGPSKLVKLKKLELDCIEGWIGERMEPDELLGDKREIKWESFRGWNKPEFGVRFEAEDIRKLALMGREEGIEISGKAVDAVAVWDAYHLEVANRKVFKAFKTKSLKDLQRLSLEHYNLCPDLDFDSLDPFSFRLFKIDLPNEDWFAASLK